MTLPYLSSDNCASELILTSYRLAAVHALRPLHCAWCMDHPACQSSRSNSGPCFFLTFISANSILPCLLRGLFIQIQGVNRSFVWWQECRVWMCMHKLDVNHLKITAHKRPSTIYGNNLWIPSSNLTEDSREHLAPSPKGFSLGVTGH